MWVGGGEDDGFQFSKSENFSFVRVGVCACVSEGESDSEREGASVKPEATTIAPWPRRAITTDSHVKSEFACSLQLAARSVSGTLFLDDESEAGGRTQKT